MLKPLIDTLFKAQEAVLKPPALKPLYECALCGDRECEFVREIPFVDCGEHVTWLVCDKHSPEEIARKLP